MTMRWDDVEGHRIPGTFEMEEAGDGSLELVRDDLQDWDEMRERLTFERRELETDRGWD